MEESSQNRAARIADAFVTALRDIVHRRKLKNEVCSFLGWDHEDLDNRLLGHDPFLLEDYVSCWEAVRIAISPSSTELDGFAGKNAPGRDEPTPKEDEVRDTSSPEALAPVGLFCFHFLERLGEEGLVAPGEIKAIGEELAERMSKSSPLYPKSR